jgi:1-deoxy-D-xylulose-5-phosphate synthase
VTVEESALPGGFGSAVLEVLADAADATVRSIPVIRIGIPGGRFVDHGAVGDLRRVLGLDAEGIRARIEAALAGQALEPELAQDGVRWA